MRFGFVVACLVAFVGCAGWLVREPERAVGVRSTRDRPTSSCSVATSSSAP
jgi:hypothetical protein